MLSQITIITMNKEFAPLLDERNIDLWEELNQQYNIVLEIKSGPGYLTNFKDDVITVLIDGKNMDPAPFTHELLHIYLKEKKVLIAGELREQIAQNVNLTGLFSDSLQEQLGNVLEHQKMIGPYRERGFEDEKFVRDYYIKIMDNQQLEDLMVNYREKGSYKRISVDIYIEKFFSMKASNNRNYDYSPYYQYFKSLDASLFSILNRFWNNWLDYGINEPQEKYRKLLYSFIRDMDRWVGKREFR